MFNYSVWVNNYNPTELFDYFMTELNNAGFGILDVIEKPSTKKQIITKIPVKLVHRKTTKQ